MNDEIILLETEEQALAAGITPDEFDSDVHLFHEEIEIHPPVEQQNAGE